MMTPVYIGAASADQKKEQNEYVPRKQYEKLEQEVEVLKAQMRLLLEREPPADQSLSPANDPVAQQAEAQTSKTDQPAISAQTVSNTPLNEGFENKYDIGVAEGSRQKEAEESRTELDTFLRRQVVLFNRGELALEFNLAYSHDTTANACFDTNLGISSRCQRNSIVAPKFITRTVDTGLLARYGLIDDLELDVGIAYGYIDQEQNFTPFDVPSPVRHNTSLGVGDLGWALRYTAWPESGYIPNITLNLNAKSRTGDEDKRLGTGFWNVGGGISFLKTIDPVVFFGSIGYTAVLERQGINPGDQIPYSVGTGFSLNDRVSFLASLVGAAVRETQFNGREIPGTSRDIHTFNFSATIQLTKRLFIEPFVAIGLTEDANDFVVGFNVPYRFDGRFPLPFFDD